MTDDYISRQAAIEAVQDYYGTDKAGRHLLMDETFLVAGLRGIPPADVRPVVSGRWEHLNWGFDYDRCSVCGYEHRWPGPFYYCPHCGADMRGVTDG